MLEHKLSTNELEELELNRITFSIESSFGCEGEFQENFVQHKIKVYYIVDLEKKSKKLIATAMLTSIDFKNHDAYQLLDLTSELYEYCILIDEETQMISEELFENEGLYNLTSFSILNRFEIVKKYRGRGWGKLIFNALYRAFNFEKSSDLLCLTPVPLQYVRHNAKPRDDESFVLDTKKIIQVYEEYGFEIINEHKNCDIRYETIMGMYLDKYKI